MCKSYIDEIVTSCLSTGQSANIIATENHNSTNVLLKLEERGRGRIGVTNRHAEACQSSIQGLQLCINILNDFLKITPLFQ